MGWQWVIVVAAVIVVLIIAGWSVWRFSPRQEVNPVTFLDEENMPWEWSLVANFDNPVARPYQWLEAYLPESVHELLRLKQVLTVRCRDYYDDYNWVEMNYLLDKVNQQIAETLSSNPLVSSNCLKLFRRLDQVATQYVQAVKSLSFEMSKVYSFQLNQAGTNLRRLVEQNVV